MTETSSSTGCSSCYRLVESLRHQNAPPKLIIFSDLKFFKYYSQLGLDAKSLNKRLKSCSRHRSKFIRPKTPDKFWSSAPIQLSPIKTDFIPKRLFDRSSLIKKRKYKLNNK
ncbi:MAG: DNA endonuclease rbbp8 [Marteilia pararefringens]